MAQKMKVLPRSIHICDDCNSKHQMYQLIIYLAKGTSGPKPITIVAKSVVSFARLFCSLMLCCRIIIKIVIISDYSFGKCSSAPVTRNSLVHCKRVYARWHVLQWTWLCDVYACQFPMWALLLGKSLQEDRWTLHRTYSIWEIHFSNLEI